MPCASRESQLSPGTTERLPCPCLSLCESKVCWGTKQTPTAVCEVDPSVYFPPTMAVCRAGPLKYAEYANALAGASGVPHRGNDFGGVRKSPARKLQRGACSLGTGSHGSGAAQAVAVATFSTRRKLLAEPCQRLFAEPSGPPKRLTSWSQLGIRGFLTIVGEAGCSLKRRVSIGEI